MFFERYGRQEQSKHISPISLRYYELISEQRGDNKRYGVGIEEVTKDSAVTLCESQFIEDVFSCAYESLNNRIDFPFFTFVVISYSGLTPLKK